jgi:acetyltransferase-like isoleucine patch superfamily enzyme
MKFRSHKRYFTRDGLPHFTRIALQLLRQRIDTRIAGLKAGWWNVKLGKGCQFIGRMYFRRAPLGKIKVGERCRFLSSFSANLHGLNRPCMLTCLAEGAVIEIGDDTGLSGCTVAAASKISIGSRVLCGANTTISDTDSHSLDFRDRHPEFFYGKQDATWMEPVQTKPIQIEDDVFLGMNVIVLKGVTIGRGAIIGAGSVVTGDIPPYCLAAGQPAVVLRRLQDNND